MTDRPPKSPEEMRATFARVLRECAEHIDNSPIELWQHNAGAPLPAETTPDMRVRLLALWISADAAAALHHLTSALEDGCSPRVREFLIDAGFAYLKSRWIRHLAECPGTAEHATTMGSTT